MSKKKLVEKKKEQAVTMERYIQYAAGGVVLLVLGFFAWQYAPEAGRGRTDFAGLRTVCRHPRRRPVNPRRRWRWMRIRTILRTSPWRTAGPSRSGFYPDKAPITVDRFVFLSCQGFFEGLTFSHRMEGFMAQGGDPTGTGMGGPGYQFVNEAADWSSTRRACWRWRTRDAIRTEASSSSPSIRRIS